MMSFREGKMALEPTRLNLTAGTIHYQKSWTALSLLMMTANRVNFTQITK
jgi:hypothetical protein